MTDPEMAARLERLLCGESLSVEEHEALRTALTQDSELKKTYDEWAAAERAVMKDDLAFERAIERLAPLAKAYVDSPPKTVIPRFRRPQIWAPITVLAAAAAMAVFLRPAEAPVLLPTYHLEIAGGEERMLGAQDAGLPKLLATSRLTLVARPTDPAPSAKVRAFWRQGDRVVTFGGTWTRSEEGAFLASGIPENLAPGLSGATELIVIVYGAGPDPEPKDLNGPDPTWRWLQTRVELRP